VCPVQIPLPKLMRHWREREFERHLTPPTVRVGAGVWAWFARRPQLYRHGDRGGGAGARVVRAGRRGGSRSLPFAGGWTRGAICRRRRARRSSADTRVSSGRGSCDERGRFLAPFGAGCGVGRCRMTRRWRCGRGCRRIRGI
jgi:hypothetical protein